jgi:hypothetical protein
MRCFSHERGESEFILIVVETVFELTRFRAHAPSRRPSLGRSFSCMRSL